MNYLRTWRDLARYLDSRAAVLHESDRRVIGAEPALLACYTAMRDTFSGCNGIADAKVVRASGKPIRNRVLIVDDEPAVTRSLARTLRKYYDVTVASGGEEALALMSANPFDAVLSDLMMRDGSGVELYGRS